MKGVRESTSVFGQLTAILQTGRLVQVENPTVHHYEVTLFEWDRKQHGHFSGHTLGEAFGKAYRSLFKEQQ